MSGGSPLGRILRRGAARNGVHHWVALHQVTSYALLPLTLWFLFALLSLPSLAYADVIAFIATPWHAVLLVLLYHAHLPPFRGGFIGVDVFFVISGFLITASILGEQDAGTFRLRDFFARRIRRIVPAVAGGR